MAQITIVIGPIPPMPERLFPIGTIVRPNIVTLADGAPFPLMMVCGLDHIGEGYVTCEFPAAAAPDLPSEDGRVVSINCDWRAIHAVAA